MVDISVTAAAHHDEASHHLIVAANLQADAAEHCLEGQYHEAQALAAAAAKEGQAATEHAAQAADIYREIVRSSPPGAVN